MNLLDNIPGVSALKMAAIGALCAGAAGGAVLLWAVAVHGPDQQRAGGLAMAAKLDTATNEAAEDLSNAAEAYRLRLAVCRRTGGLRFDPSTGECER